MPRYLLVNYKQAYIVRTAPLRDPSLRVSKNSDCYFVCFSFGHNHIKVSLALVGIFPSKPELFWPNNVLVISNHSWQIGWTCEGGEKLGAQLQYNCHKKKYSL